MNKQNSSLIYRIDNYIGNDPLLTQRDKERFENWLLQPSKKKKNKHLVPRLITIVLIMGFASVMYLLFISQNQDLEQTTADYPTEVREKIAELPEEIQEKINVPTEFPTEPENVQFSYNTEPYNDPKGKITDATFTYFGDEEAAWQAHLRIVLSNVTVVNEKIDDTLVLDNGSTAKISDSEDFKEISWYDDKNIYYNLIFADIEKKYSVDDVLKIANSISN
ncbi:hypothetical protein [Oceanobacillus massiliensis]|uniref:hypothetical protein n=1 Tax=Oceanobacillus massiliensis TaxID=1465765 RepID=UPI003019044E